MDNYTSSETQGQQIEQNEVNWAEIVAAKVFYNVIKLLFSLIILADVLNSWISRYI